MIQCLCENRRPQGSTSAERGHKRKRWCEVIGRDKGSWLWEELGGVGVFVLGSSKMYTQN